MFFPIKPFNAKTGCMGESIFSAVEIEINHACNRKCSYCPNSILKRKNTGEIDGKLFHKLMGELRVLEFDGRISYDFYNEPMLHSDLEGIVRETKRHLPKARIELYTNGTLLRKDVFSGLLKAGITRFVVTRHENEKNHIFSSVYDELSEKERLFVHYRPYTDLKLTNRGGTLRHLGEGLTMAPCFIPSYIVTVTVTGNVLPCFEDFHENLVMGNLKNSSLMEIWNSERYSLFRRNLRLGKRGCYNPCQDCSRTETLPPIY